MCGLAAIFETGSGEPDIGKAIARMHGALAHRGPDGEGYLWLDAAFAAHSERGIRLPAPAIPANARFAAAFRWLRIQDLDLRSNQPMATPGERFWILFNGEIYNHRDLRRELEAAGETFATHSDTEVALAAYARWGHAAFARFDGMWAMAIVDVANRELVLSRDRLGIKPLYYAVRGGRLLVASEPKAIVAAEGGAPAADAFRVHEFLRGLPPQSADLSFFAGVRPLAAGTFAVVKLDRPVAAELEARAYWNLADFRAEETPESQFEAKREEFEALLRASLESHARAAVDVGALLSGGLDTSILARLLAEDAGRRGAPAPKTYSIIFEDPAMSEWPYMQLVIAKGGLDGRNFVLTPSAALASVAPVVEAQGQPLLGQDAIAQYHAYRIAREHGSPVVVEGQGSDELLAGMPLYDAQQFPEMLAQGRIVRFGQEVHLRMQRYGIGLREALGTYVAMPLRVRRMENAGLPRYDWLDSARFDSTRFGPGRTADWGPERDALGRFLYRHVRHTNLPAAVMYQDRSSMAHAVESRVPFLDHRLVEFAFRLPQRFKVHRGVRKRILLETARKYLPEAVVERRDKRIFISRTGWLGLAARIPDELRDMARSSEIAAFAMLKAPRVAAFVDDFVGGRHRDEMAVWRLYTFWHWLRRFRAAS